MSLEIKVLYGTESGESQLVAEEIFEVLDANFTVGIHNMDEIEVAELDVKALYLIVCSTYGEGELPASARGLYQALSNERPDLSAMRYAMFGRGDSTYQTFLQGSRQMDALLSSLGATRVGEYGFEDAADWQAPDDLGARWAQGVLEGLNDEKRVNT